MITRTKRKLLRRELRNTREIDPLKEKTLSTDSELIIETNLNVNSRGLASFTNFLVCLSEYPCEEDLRALFNPTNIMKIKLNSPQGKELLAEITNAKVLEKRHWAELFYLSFPDKFCRLSKEYAVFLFKNLLQNNYFDSLEKLLCINHFLLAPFWESVEGPSIEKVNLTLYILKRLVNKYVKIALDINTQDVHSFDRIHYKMIENLRLEFSSLLKPLFESIKKKTSCMYAFILVSQMIQKLHSLNLLVGLDKDDLDRLSIKLNHPQREAFTELFYTKNEKSSDRNAVLNSPVLADMRESLSQAITVYETRNSCSFSEIWQAFETFVEGLEYLKENRPGAFNIMMEFKILLQTSTEIIEYFCTKPTNNNTTNMYFLDEYLLKLKPFIELMTTKRRSGLKVIYLKANQNFDKEPNENVLNLLEPKSAVVQPDNRELLISKHQNKEKVVSNADILVDIKFVSKIQETIQRLKFIYDIQERIIGGKLWATDQKVISKFIKLLFKVLRDNVKYDTEAVTIIEEMLLKFLTNIPLGKKNLFLFKSHYEAFSENNADSVKAHIKIFRQIEEKLDILVRGEDKNAEKTPKKVSADVVDLPEPSDEREPIISSAQSNNNEQNDTSRILLESYNRVCALNVDDLFQNQQECRKFYESYCLLLRNLDAMKDIAATHPLKTSFDEFLEKLEDISLALGRNIIYCFSKRGNEREFFCTMMPLLKRAAEKFNLSEDLYNFTFYYNFEWKLVTSSVFRLEKCFGGRVLRYKSPYVERVPGERDISKRLILDYQERTFTEEEINYYFDSELRLFEESQDGLNHFKKYIIDNFDKFRFFEAHSQEERQRRKYIIFAHNEKFKPKRNMLFYYTFCNLKFLTF